MTSSTDDEGAPWARLAYTPVLDDEPLHCLEVTRTGTADAPTGVLSRWGADAGPESLPDLVVESEVLDADDPAEDPARAVAALRAWLSHARVTLGDWSREGFAKDDAALPDTVDHVPDALVVDGVVVPGAVARMGDLTARAARRGGHALVVVRRGPAGAVPERVVPGMPRLAPPAM